MLGACPPARLLTEADRVRKQAKAVQSKAPAPVKAQVKEEPKEESLVQVQDQENKVYQTADDILRKWLSDRFAARGRGLMG